MAQTSAKRSVAFTLTERTVFVKGLSASKAPLSEATRNDAFSSVFEVTAT